MTARLDGAARGGHHELPIHHLVALLDTDQHRGLDEDEATRRLAEQGPNELAAGRRTPTLVRAARQFHHPLIYVLLAAALVTGLLGEYVDCSVILGVVVVNAAVGFIQEHKAEVALEGLRSMVLTKARVVRAGRTVTVNSADLVVGDLVLLEAGDKVPADLRLVRLTHLQIDESALTGESVSVVKDEVALPATTPVADRRNMAYSGALVTSGSGAGIVVATGSATELGQIHRLVGSATTLQTPLTAKLASFSKLLTVVILALAALTFAAGMLHGQDPVETFTAAVALAVGAIPEGLPAAVTITLAIGVARMAQRRAVIRRLPAVETLGGTTVICSDKTGTLTENQMTVTALWTPSGSYSVTGSGLESGGAVIAANPGGDAGPPGDPTRGDEALRWTLVVGAVCNDACVERSGGTVTVAGDPTEAAMLIAADKSGLDHRSMRAVDFPRRAALPFTAERQYMATLHDDVAGKGHVLLVKGAAERLCELCRVQMGADGGVQTLDEAAVRTAAIDLAGGGLRVLATAVGRPCGGPNRPDGPASFRGGFDVDLDFDENDVGAYDLVFTGLQAMIDPPRPAAVAAVGACRSAGIDVKMVTGDHAVTAEAIARRVGLLAEQESGGVLTGEQLSHVPDASIPEVVDRTRVFARVSPEQKLRLVEGLQARGHVVAMTGDGVNDAPALRRANIGVAMGRGGTEVAKDAADMVLTDDDFATIEAAVEEGRGVFDNLTKFIVWTLPTNMGEGLVILVAILLGTALPILPTQVLWINMTTAVLLGLMLAFEPKEPGIMTRPPRPPDRALLTGQLVVRILLVSAVLVGGAWWLFEWEQAAGSGLAEARTAAMNVFVVVEAFYLFSCRSLTRSAWSLGPLSNRWVIGGVALQALGQVMITYLPFMNTLFGTAPIGVDVWGRILLVALIASLTVSVHKRFSRAHQW